METLFQTSMLGYKVTVYPAYLSYKKSIFGSEITIPLDKVASVISGMPGVQRITIETSGGKKYKIPVRLSDKSALCEAIYRAKG